MASYIGRDTNVNNLTHWKYVKKKRVNGKWRYYYDDPYKKVYDKPTVFDASDKRFFKTNDVTATNGDRVINRSMHVNDLFGSKDSQEIYTPSTRSGKTIVNTRYYGKIDRFRFKVQNIASDVINAGKKYVKKIYNKYSKKSVNEISKTAVDAGKKYLEKMLGKK